MRRLAAAAIAIAAIALLAVGLLPADRLHGFLSAGAGHSVTAGYVDAFRLRAIVCAMVAMAIAVATWRIPLPSPAREAWHSPGIVFWIIVAIGAAARIALLPLPPRYDEAFTVTEFVRHGPLSFLILYKFPNNHVFHTLLVWLVSLVAGDRMWALRLPAFIAGIGVLFATYALARKWKDENTALIATALAAVASPLVEYSAQARGYTMLTLAFLLLLLLDSAIALALGMWTIPTMIYAAATWGVLRIKAWRSAIAGGAITFLLYLPMIVTSGVATFTENGVTRAVDLPTFARELPRMIADLARQWSFSFTMPLAIAIAIAALIAVIRRAPAAMPFAASIAVILPMLLLTRRVPFARVWIFVMPLYLIAAVSTIGDLVPKRASWILPVVTALLAWNAVRAASRPDFYEDPAMGDVPAIAAKIRTLPPDARVLVTTPLDASFELYAPGRIVQDRFDSDPVAVRAAIMAAPRRYFVGSLDEYRRLQLPFTPTPVARFPHATLFELRSPQ